MAIILGGVAGHKVNGGPASKIDAKPANDIERRLTELHRITADPAQCGGRRCLRIRVGDVLSLLAVGASRQEILEDYPLLEDGDITAALEYAARASDHVVLNVDSNKEARLRVA